jgi:hypothetical protein
MHAALDRRREPARDVVDPGRAERARFAMSGRLCPGAAYRYILGDYTWAILGDPTNDTAPGVLDSDTAPQPGYRLLTYAFPSPNTP